MVKPVAAKAATSEPQAMEVARPLTRSSKRAMSFVFGAHRLLGEEITFAGDEMLDRAKTETHLFSEFLSKLAQAHSVNDIRTVYEVCGQHQLDFLRRDCERLMRHTQRSVDAWSRLFSDGTNPQT
jgi:hypothetical protein